MSEGSGITRHDSTTAYTQLRKYSDDNENDENHVNKSVPQEENVGGIIVNQQDTHSKQEQIMDMIREEGNDHANEDSVSENRSTSICARKNISHSRPHPHQNCNTSNRLPPLTPNSSIQRDCKLTDIMTLHPCLRLSVLWVLTYSFTQQIRLNYTTASSDTGETSRTRTTCTEDGIDSAPNQDPQLNSPYMDSPSFCSKTTPTPDDGINHHHQHQQYQTQIPSTRDMNFFERIENRSNKINSLLCVGLDPHLKELNLSESELENEEARCNAAYSFCTNIIAATAPFAAAYKPNAAFFEALGPNCGVSTLKRVVDYIHAQTSKDDDTIPILLDCKRGDIGSTAAAYAESSYDHLNADGVTLSPLMGWDSISPFVTGKYSHKGAFLLCKTSNPGSNDILTQKLSDDKLLYEQIAKLSKSWNESEDHAAGNKLGLVVGATDIEALARVRNVAGDDVWILSPGVGFQGGDLIGTMKNGLNSKGSGLLVPISRGISRAENIKQKSEEFRDLMNNARQEILTGKSQTNSCEDIADYQRKFIEFSLSQGVLKFGSFVLKSGRTSPYFFNAGLFSSGAALSSLGRAYAESIVASEFNNNGTVTFDVIFGPAYKGISLGAVVASALYNDFGIDVGFAYNRKEAKDHGEGGVLVGASMKGKRVLIVDDVITAGTAIRESFSMLTGPTGAIPVGVSIALDRAEKRAIEDPVSAVQAVARDLGIPVVSIVSLPQLQQFLKGNDKYGADVLEKVTAYRSQYGV